MTALVEDLCHEREALDRYLRHHRVSPSHAKQLLTDNPAYQDLLAAYFAPESDELSLWKNAPYDSNPKHPEHLTHKTLSGKNVRSKSEAIIDAVLYTNKIPFRYECALNLSDFIVYPDFTIRHPKTGQIYYWEHFGLMDNPAYAKNACSKLQLYISHDIIPSIHLITTYETKDNPLSYDYVMHLVKHHFMC